MRPARAERAPKDSRVAVTKPAESRKRDGWGESGLKNFRPWLALIVLDAALFANQYVTLPRLKRFVLAVTSDEPTTAIQTSAVELVLTHWRENFTATDVLIGAVALAALGYMVYAEIRHGALSGLLRRAEVSRGVCYGLLAIGALAAARCYLAPGEVFMGDSEAHTIRCWVVAESLRKFQPPVWSNYWYGGYPPLAYYAPLFFWITGSLALLFGDVHLAVKLVLWTSHVASMFAMFWFLREATGRVRPAVLGAFAYGLAFHRLHIILYGGDLNLSLIFVLYPLLFFLIERFVRTRARPRTTFLWFTLTMAALILTHHGYGFFGSVLVGLYLLVRLALTPMAFTERARVLAFFGAAVVAAGAVSTFSLAPYVLDAHLVRGMKEAPFEILIPNWRIPILLYRRFFHSPIYYMFHWTLVGDAGNIGYVGLSIGLFALVAIPFVVKRRMESGIALLACALTSLFMMRNFIDFNIKNTNFFVFFLAALAGFSVLPLESLALKLSLLRKIGRLPERLTVILLGILILDLGPTTFHSVYREDYDFKERMYERIRSIDGNHKVVERRVLRYVPGPDQEKYYEPGNLGVANAHSRIFTPLGRFHEGAAISFGYNAEMVKNLQRDLHQDGISELSLTGLYLMGVKYVTFRSRYRYYTPALAPSPHYGLEDGLLTLNRASPLILSRHVITAGEVEGYDTKNIIEARQYFDPETYDHGDERYRKIVVPLIERMGVDRERGVADVLIVHQEEKDIRLLTEPGDAGEQGVAGEGTLEVEVRTFSADLDSVVVGYRSNMEAVGQLSYSYFPYLVVDVDGRPTRFFRSAMSYILVPLPAGEHVVTIHGVASPNSRWSFLFSSVFLVLLLALPGSLFAPFATRTSAV